MSTENSADFGENDCINDCMLLDRMLLSSFLGPFSLQYMYQKARTPCPVFLLIVEVK